MSDWLLSFAERINYSLYGDFIFPILLTSANSQVAVRVKLDTGSILCVLQPSYAELLGFDLESGTRERIRTAMGSFTAYGHEVTLTVGGLEWQATVYFAADELFPVNVVGRIGFIDRLRLGLVDYESLLYLNAHEEFMG